MHKQLEILKCSFLPFLSGSSSRELHQLVALYVYDVLLALDADPVCEEESGLAVWYVSSGGAPT